MAVDLDTFLVAVYTEVDTLYQTGIAPGIPVRPGPLPKMVDSEVLTLMLVGQWRGSSERGLLRYADAHLSAYFPVLLSQSAFNRRARVLGPVCTQLMVRLADVLGADTVPYQIVDTTPVPLARQCRGKRHRLFADDAAVGRGGSDHQFYYGCALLLAVAADGPITGFLLGPASTQDRWLLDALLTWRVAPDGIPWTVDDLPPSHATGGSRVGPTGPRWWPDSAGHAGTGVYLADRGFTGKDWLPHWEQDTAAVVLTGVAPDLPLRLRRAHHGWRQTIETINGLLADVFHLAFPQAKTMWGVVTRVAAKCTALNLGIWCNRLFGRDDLAVDTLFSG